MPYFISTGTTGLSGSLPARDLPVPDGGDGCSAKVLNGTQDSVLLPAAIQ